MHELKQRNVQLNIFKNRNIQNDLILFIFFCYNICLYNNIIMIVVCFVKKSAYLNSIELHIRIYIILAFYIKKFLINMFTMKVICK